MMQRGTCGMTIGIEARQERILLELADFLDAREVHRLEDSLLILSMCMVAFIGFALKNNPDRADAVLRRTYETMSMNLRKRMRET
jgi:hypothetical protein